MQDVNEVVSISNLGAKGDGVAEDGTFVPFTLPGERVRVDRLAQRAVASEIVEASPARVTPPCPHFGTCGGCDLQHASTSLYAEFKRGLVVDAFRRTGIEAEIAPLIEGRPGTRRRAVFTAARAGNRILFGFSEARSHRICDLSTCLVVTPAIERALPTLRRLASLLIDRRKPLRLTVLDTAAGLDVAVADTARLDDALRRKAVTVALEVGLARLAVSGETLVEAGAPLLQVGTASVAPPPGAFVQAVAEAETAMAALAVEHLMGASRVADLFSGVGTFALRFAATAPVHAVESEAASLAALDRAARGAPRLRPVTTERRDLVRRPLAAKELERFDGVCFDPPRAGAQAQTETLASSRVERIAAISCNPITLARDVKNLMEGGYRVRSVTPIDQFVWSHHVEAVALLERR